jgi:hypothetical protein
MAKVRTSRVADRERAREKENERNFISIIAAIIAANAKTRSHVGD